MVKEKRKNDSLSNSSTLAFILLWSVSYAVGFGALWLTTEAINSERYYNSFIAQNFRYWDVTSTLILFGLIMPALIQTVLVKGFLPGSTRGWISLTVVGIILSWLFLRLTQGLVSNERHYEDLKFGLLIFSLFTPVAVIQMMWLAQNMKRAELWPLVSLVGTFVFVCIFNSRIFFPSDLSRGRSDFVLAGALYGLMMGSTMFYLHIDVLWHSQTIERG